MAKHLYQLTNNLKGYLCRHNALFIKQAQANGHGQLQYNQPLPDALQLAMLRGEAVLRLHIFDWLNQKGYDDATSYQLYSKLFEGSAILTSFCQHIGLVQSVEDTIRQGVGKQNKDFDSVCWQLYCIFIDCLSQDNKTQLLHDATIGLAQHYLPQYFPKAENITLSLEHLKKECKLGLRQHYHAPVELKESFTCGAKGEPDSVSFALIAHLPNCYPCEVVRVTAHRTRSARYQAYHQLLALIKDDKVTAEPIAKPSRKNKPMLQL